MCKGIVIIVTVFLQVVMLLYVAVKLLNAKRRR